MAQERVRRIREAIREEISDIMRNEMKDPRVGFASVTSVEVSGDLRNARVYISVLGGEEERRQTMAALESARGFIRGEVGRRLRLRFAPELVFVADESIAHGAHIARLLAEIRRNEAGGPARPAREDGNDG